MVKAGDSRALDEVKGRGRGRREKKKQRFHTEAPSKPAAFGFFFLFVSHSMQRKVVGWGAGGNG